MLTATSATRIHMAPAVSISGDFNLKWQLSTSLEAEPADFAWGFRHAPNEFFKAGDRHFDNYVALSLAHIPSQFCVTFCVVAADSGDIARASAPNWPRCRVLEGPASVPLAPAALH